jgi:hypothetical protein
MDGLGHGNARGGGVRGLSLLMEVSFCSHQTKHNLAPSGPARTGQSP